MEGSWLSKTELDQLRDVCSQYAWLAAVYAFDVRPGGDNNLALLYSSPPGWSERLDLEFALSEALNREGLELMTMKRLPLVSRFNVITKGSPLYVGRPEVLAAFIEETIARYTAYYPLLEALYWKSETGSVQEDEL